MRAILLQGWTTVRGLAGSGTAGVNQVVQGVDGWLDLSPYQDCGAWIDCRETSASGGGSITMNLETAPARDDSLFMPLVPGFALAASATPVVKGAMLAGATNPLARFVRWRLSVATSAGTWDATFRIWLAVAAPGA